MMTYRISWVIAVALLGPVGCSGGNDPATGGGERIAANGPVPDTASASGDSLDQAYRDLIANEETFAKIMAGIHSKRDAENAIAPLQKYFQDRDAIYLRLAHLGAEMPPLGIPPEHRPQYKAAQDLQESVHQRLSQHPEAEGIHATLRVLNPDVTDVEVLKAFRLSSELRRHGQDNIVYVELKNREALVGPQHQKMAQLLKDTAGALHAEALIEGDTYSLVLAPVGDLQAFAQKINIGTVSQIDPAQRRMVLTLDPAKLPAESAGNVAVGPGVGPSGNPYAPGRTPSGAIPGLPPSAGDNPAGGELDPGELMRVEHARMHLAQIHGRDGIIEFHLKNARELGAPRMGKVSGAIQQAAGGRLLQIIPLRSGAVYAFFHSKADVTQLSTSLDLGPVESVDAVGRRIVILLDESKIPQ